MKMRGTQSIIREHSVVDKENIMDRADTKLGDLVKQEVEDAVQKRDITALKRYASICRAHDFLY